LPKNRQQHDEMVSVCATLTAAGIQGVHAVRI
jgi:hypothetical protein